MGWNFWSVSYHYIVDKWDNKKKMFRECVYPEKEGYTQMQIAPEDDLA